MTAQFSRYDTNFISYASQSSAYSARVIVSFMAAKLAPASVLDVGCSSGTWLRAWQDNGVQDIYGVDGEYVPRQLLEIRPEDFSPFDLNKPLDLDRQFELVQSLEVAEHVERSSSTTFVDNLVRHAAKFLLFSAAPSGQGGMYHVNEQPYDYWRNLFFDRGFEPFDVVRPQIFRDPRVSYWYRYNTFLYVRREFVQSLPEEFQSHLVPRGTPLRDVSPIAFRVRKALVAMLPLGVQQHIARLKSRILPTGRL